MAPPNAVTSLPATPVTSGALLINWIGQAGFLFKTATSPILCIDPYLSNCIERYEGLQARRMWWPSFGFEGFQVDAVLCTHDHIDHTDPDTIPLIAAYNPKCIFYGPASACAHMGAMSIAPQRLRVIAAGNEYWVGDIRLRPVFAKHTPDGVGLIMEAAGLTVYITGDTEYCPDIFTMKKESPDVLITCINGIYGNLNSEQACELAEKLGVKAAIPMHYGVVPANTVTPYHFAGLCGRKGIACHVLTAEKNYLLSKGQHGSVDVSQ